MKIYLAAQEFLAACNVTYINDIPDIHQFVLEGDQT
jgi:hypothetical protein